MKRPTIFSTILLLTIFSPTNGSLADTFGADSNTFAIEFVDVGNPGNVADTTGLPNPAGTVDYAYRIGKYEISEDMIDKANALGDLGITHNSRSASQPATSVSWFEAAQFINWLNTSTDSVPAYKFDGDGSFQVWEAGDAGYNPDNLYRNSLARYFLPGTHEWYKAAYYDPVADVYYNYPTGSNSIPDGLDDEDDPEFDAVFYDGDHNPEPNDVTDVGITSPYGTAGQGGNIAEWIESAESLDNGAPPTGRHVRGGQWDDEYTKLWPDIVGGGAAGTGYFFVGFRVASAVIALPGDYNGDGTVNAADYVVYRNRQAGIGGTTLINEGETPGMVTIEDYNFWKQHYGDTLGSGAATHVAESLRSEIRRGGDSETSVSERLPHVPNVPEPATSALLVITLPFIACLERRRLRSA